MGRDAPLYSLNLLSMFFSFQLGTSLWFSREIIGTLRPNDADGNENVKKTKDLISKTTALHVDHAFLYISFLFLDDFYVKMPNFAF